MDSLLDANEVYETMKGHGAAWNNPDAIAYRYQVAGHMVELIHPDRTDRFGRPTVVPVQADQIIMYVDQKGFRLPEKSASQSADALEAKAREMRETAKGLAATADGFEQEASRQRQSNAELTSGPAVTIDTSASPPPGDEDGEDKQPDPNRPIPAHANENRGPSRTPETAKK